MSRRRRQPTAEQIKERLKGRRALLRLNYNLTLEEFEEMASRQHHCCAICKRKAGDRVLNVDHDHRTGKVRGLLCSACNTALGVVDDSPRILAQMIVYLEDHGTSWVSELFRPQRR